MKKQHGKKINENKKFLKNNSKTIIICVSLLILLGIILFNGVMLNSSYPEYHSSTQFGDMTYIIEGSYNDGLFNLYAVNINGSIIYQSAVDITGYGGCSQFDIPDITTNGQHIYYAFSCLENAVLIYRSDMDFNNFYPEDNGGFLNGAWGGGGKQTSIHVNDEGTKLYLVSEKITDYNIDLIILDIENIDIYFVFTNTTTIPITTGGIAEYRYIFKSNGDTVVFDNEKIYGFSVVYDLTVPGEVDYYLFMFSINYDGTGLQTSLNDKTTTLDFPNNPEDLYIAKGNDRLFYTYRLTNDTECAEANLLGYYCNGRDIWLGSTNLNLGNWKTTKIDYKGNSQYRNTWSEYDNNPAVAYNDGRLYLSWSEENYNPPEGGAGAAQWRSIFVSTNLNGEDKKYLVIPTSFNNTPFGCCGSDYIETVGTYNDKIIFTYNFLYENNTNGLFFTTFTTIGNTPEPQVNNITGLRTNQMGYPCKGDIPYPCIPANFEDAKTMDDVNLYQSKQRQHEER